jgi:hypothetical protein
MDDQANDPAVPTEEQKLERAKSGGYVEPEAPSLTERAATLVADMERAMAHNAPVTTDMLREMKALLGVSGE